jgi:hypothetical protein
MGEEPLEEVPGHDGRHALAVRRSRATVAALALAVRAAVSRTASVVGLVALFLKDVKTAPTVQKFIAT